MVKGLNIKVFIFEKKVYLEISCLKLVLEEQKAKINEDVWKKDAY